MTREISGYSAVVFAGLLVASCTNGGKDGVGDRKLPPMEQVRRSAGTGAAASNEAYVATAASIDLFEIQSSELVRQRSTNKLLREFAAMMINAHRGTSAQLSLSGRRLNLLPSPKLSGRHQRMLEELRSAANFDATYRRQQEAIHQEALALHSAYVARGSSPTLRPVAASMKPIIERHIRMLRHL